MGVGAVLTTHVARLTRERAALERPLDGFVSCAPIRIPDDPARRVGTGSRARETGGRAEPPARGHASARRKGAARGTGMDV